MIVESVLELKKSLKPGRRALGLDVGTKTVGLALSDAGLMAATPYKTLKRGKFAKLALEIRQIMAEMEVGGLVIGLPLSMDGSEGPRCRATRDFAANLLRALGGDKGNDFPILFYDERLSTAAVQRMLINEAGMTRQRRAQVIDKAAAAYILQGALDAMANAK